MGRAATLETRVQPLSKPRCCVMATSRSKPRSFDPVSPADIRGTRRGVAHIPGGTDSCHHRSVGRAGGSALTHHEHTGAHQQQAAQCQPTRSAHGVDGRGHRLLNRGGGVDHRVLRLGTPEDSKPPRRRRRRRRRQRQRAGHRRSTGSTDRRGGARSRRDARPGPWRSPGCRQSTPSRPVAARVGVYGEGILRHVGGRTHRCTRGPPDCFPQLMPPGIAVGRVDVLRRASESSLVVLGKTAGGPTRPANRHAAPAGAVLLGHRPTSLPRLSGPE